MEYNCYRLCKEKPLNALLDLQIRLKEAFLFAASPLTINRQVMKNRRAHLDINERIPPPPPSPDAYQSDYYDYDNGRDVE
jgi:hypothetical protein